LITDPRLSANNRNNRTHTAGTTFFGQFLDHDITFDTGSPLGVPTDPADSVNSRSPSLGLDSLYGAAPSQARSCTTRGLSPASLRRFPKGIHAG
jgi:hypothetical protein